MTFALCRACGLTHAVALPGHEPECATSTIYAVPTLTPRGDGFVRYTGPAWRGPEGEMAVTCGED